MRLVSFWLPPIIGLALLIPRSSFPAAPSSALLKAKQEAEAKGFIFETSHDEVVAKAKKEGRLRALSNLEPPTIRAMSDAFRKRYAIDVHAEEITGAEAGQRFVLELKGGRVKDWDVMHISADFYNEYEGHKKNFDVLGMATHGVLRIPRGMLDQRKRNVIFPTSVFSVVTYNKNLIAPGKVPDAWEDFLKPEFKGKKFSVEIRGGVKDLVAMIPAWGSERVLNYAKALAGQEPIWTIGYARSLGSMVAGDLALAHMMNWHSTVRAQQKDATRSLGYKVLEPVPVRLTVADGVIANASHPYAGLLWLEFLATPEAQAIIDKHDPLKSNLYVRGSEVANVLSGKRVSVSTPEEADTVPQLMEKVIAAMGFPKVEKK
ncbi:MAG: ABC transporter substrate-binding protein [Candidatus Binatia bacterium]